MREPGAARMNGMQSRRLSRVVGPLLSGAMMLQVGGCLREDVAGQFRDGIISSISGFFRIVER